MLSLDDFNDFFNEVYGYAPFPWQTRLLERIAAKNGEWPSVLDLPTGSGKTAAIDIAVFYLALQADRGHARRAPVRIAFVVDRRLVVDDAFMRAKTLADALIAPPGPVTTQVADRLKTLSLDGPPLIARRLRGGIPREDDWARTPSQPIVLCSTVDQVGSRLLFRGYGVSDSMKPVHAGLVGTDCLILLDEAHLAEPFRQTLEWVRIYKGNNWREKSVSAPWGVALLTATSGEGNPDGFTLEDDDRAHPVLKQRLEAKKQARLVSPAKSEKRTSDFESVSEAEELGQRSSAIVKEVLAAIEHFREEAHGASKPAIGVVVNRVVRARKVFDQLSGKIDPNAVECLLLIGPARPVDRDDIADRLASIRTKNWKAGERRLLAKPLILVATQCIEVGVDIDLDALITEAAPLDCLRQRFGRLNRAGRGIAPYAAILAAQSDIAARVDDPVYGKAIKAAWTLLEKTGKPKKAPVLDFGLNSFAVHLERDALAPKEDAPVLMPAHLDLLCQTAPIPAADPEVALYLHGPRRQPDSVTVVWRADIALMMDRNDDARRLLTLTPPRSTEAIELPLWAVRRWLGGKRDLADLADVATAAPEETENASSGAAKRIFRWRGNDERSCWIEPREIRPGDSVVVPAYYGGVDEFGWNPEYKKPVADVWRKAVEPFKGRRFAVRVAAGLIGENVTSDALGEALASATSWRWQDIRSVLLDLDLPQIIRDDLLALDNANRKKSVTAYVDLYGMDDGFPRGAVFVAPFGIGGNAAEEDGRPNATEDDISGSIPGFSCPLEQHSRDVERKVGCFATAAGLPDDLISDLQLSGYLHDGGKTDRRFQAWLYYYDPLGPDLNDDRMILAKSGRSLPKTAHTASGLPKKWRHEALSVRLTPYSRRFTSAHDPELVLWLIGTHHGHGRPFFPHQDPNDGESRVLPSLLGLPDELPAAPGPQSLAFDWQGLDWATLFERLKDRYGIWELARMEAILRLADHRASEDRSKGDDK